MKFSLNNSSAKKITAKGTLSNKILFTRKSCIEKVNFLISQKFGKGHSRKLLLGGKYSVEFTQLVDNQDYGH
jgi:hypothetical protein